MAKSLRSKFKRKIRAIARVKKAPKEQARLETVVACQVAYDKETAEKEADLVKNAPGTNVPSEMDTNNEPPKVSTLNVKTMKRADGSYPVWLNQGKKTKLARLARKGKNNKKGKSKGNR